VILTRVSLVYDLKKLYLNPASSFIISSGLGKLSQRFSESLVYVFQKRKLLFRTLPLLLTIKLPYVFQKRKLWSFNKNTIQIAIIYNICNQKFLILP